MIMLLAVDVGNTHTVIGIYEAGQRVHPQHMWRIATNKSDTSDDVRAKLLPLMAAVGLSAGDVHAVALASVVPSLTRAWQQAMREVAGVEVQVCTAEAARDAGLFEADYPNPHEIGADRVADAVAARALYGCPVVVVDFGTATNIEVIDERGLFVGGIIAPGVETSARALFAHATRLSATDLVAPPAPVGTNTEEAIQSGIVLGEADRVDGLVRRIFGQMERRGTVVATGGLAALVAAHSNEITRVLPELTLEGLRLLAEAGALASAQANGAEE